MRKKVTSIIAYIFFLDSLWGKVLKKAKLPGIFPNKIYLLFLYVEVDIYMIHTNNFTREINIGLFLTIIIILLNTNNNYSFFTTNLVKSNIDGNSYPVISSYEEQQKASDTIAKINLFTLQLLFLLKEQYLSRSPATPEEIKGFEIISILLEKYSPKALSENKPTSDKDTSYTQNKGEIISLCLREKQSGLNKIHSLDIIKFVMLHELAHIITPETTHSNLFWTNFRFLLEFCKKHNIYTAPDFGKNNEVYCGMTIRYNPEYDNIRTISYF